MPWTIRSIFCGRARPVASVNERAVPVSRTVLGMMLNAVPPWMEATVTTAESSGETSRDTIDWRASTTRAAARIGSAASWGEAPWPPRPLDVDRELVDRGHEGSPVDSDRADRQRSPQVEAQSGADAFQSALVRARLSAAAPLLGGLEEEAHGGAGPARPRGARRPPARSPRGRRGRRRACGPVSSEAYGAPVSSSRGSASMSARSIRRRPSGSAVGEDARSSRLRSAEPGRAPPAGRRRCAAVRRSSNASSGCRCRSRRVATRRSYSPEGKSESRRSRCGTAGL